VSLRGLATPEPTQGESAAAPQRKKTGKGAAFALMIRRNWITTALWLLAARMTATALTGAHNDVALAILFYVVGTFTLRNKRAGCFARALPFYGVALVAAISLAGKAALGDADGSELFALFLATAIMAAIARVLHRGTLLAWFFGNATPATTVAHSRFATRRNDNLSDIT
jgi:hypothetical protein